MVTERACGVLVRPPRVTLPGDGLRSAACGGGWMCVQAPEKRGGKNSAMFNVNRKQREDFILVTRETDSVTPFPTQAA
jgi:hypothetical protein